MSEKIIIANWKANKNLKNALYWVEEVKPALARLKKKIILCPPAVFLTSLSNKIKDEELEDFIALGSQDVSRYPPGAYTGEISVEQLVDLVSFVIVGHSERRKYFFEKSQDVIEKVRLLLDLQIPPILCISDLAQLDSYISEGKIIVENSEKIIFVYEPPEAISGGGEYHPDSPEDVQENVLKIREKIGKQVTAIYGGSINPDNARSFFTKKNIDGGLVGQASLDPATFIQIVEAANN